MSEKIDWDPILGDIAKGQAVLLLGHGFVPGMHQKLFQRFQEKIGEGLLHFYERDGLFLFSDLDAKISAQDETVALYEQSIADAAMLRKIGELPFCLMVNANPDKNLFNTFDRFGLPLQFDYFSSKNKYKDYPVERPSTDYPLLYNLCGSYEDPESLLLDYDDLFDLLKALLPGGKIPKSEVEMPLEMCRTFIFIGFRFERWYTQLFLRYLNMNDRINNKKRNYVLKTTLHDKDTEQFFIQQFKVKYIGADTAFFDELHFRFSEKYPEKMRKIAEELSDEIAAVIKLIRKNEYESVFRLLHSKEAIQPKDKDLLITTESEYRQYLKNRSDGTVNQENLQVQLAKVRRNLIEIAKTLP